ncbi:family 10 glycosylhydrolase [Cohnella hashimotonis]|uniref:Family 10 glycosylhydrolase n=1 Tax=Cohnella hashimotonis TaxID=2826895 RepID=A0ABT6TGW1_9BACL|nr:family 10 glycosylhydrolase [Cohnella hashimotonis]MDI4646082.1 family 10 glycosylhydrolase [Cohnella hashimotonis]
MAMPLLFALLLCLPLVPQAGAAKLADITVYLDGAKLPADVPPYIDSKLGATMVPIRTVSEGLGASIVWEQKTQTATIAKGADTIILTSGKKNATVNGSAVPLDASVQNKAGRIMVPLRFIGENLGLYVVWDPVARSVVMRSNSGENGGGNGGQTGGQPGGGNQGGGGSNDPGLRGAWISTVFNLDWPSTAAYGNESKQKQEFSAMLDQFQQMGLNAVFLQVRPASDALYRSMLVPWSKVLTGTQGRDPGYDPLTYLIEETHRRGMQFHAWFNPFRSNTDTKTAALAGNHVAVEHPEWIVTTGTTSYINPGIPEARQHIIDTIMEVVNGYDIDGVHLDDYFYPSSGVFSDDATFALHNPTGILLKTDWRRDNINTFVRDLGFSIHAAKPSVSFGISPFGVWRNASKDPTGSDTKAGVTAYDSMYADVRTWIRQGWIDYVAPQIYWSMSYSAARYDKLVDWWSGEVAGTSVKLYIGHATYKLGTAEAGWQSAGEIINQLKYNAAHPMVQGDIYYSATSLLKNTLGIVPALQNYYGQSSNS